MCIHVYVRVYSRTYADFTLIACVFTCVCTLRIQYVFTHICAQIHVYMRKNIYVHECESYKHSPTPAHAHVNIYLHVHTYFYIIHIHIYMCILVYIYIYM